MCLTINKKCHSLRNGKPLAKIAKKDIKCYKLLVIKSRGTIFSNGCHKRYIDWMTPYKCYNVKFKDGHCILRAKISPIKINPYKDVIGKGIHSFLSKDVNGLGGYRFNAIIPKGTRYYIGDCGDMVSEKLIIYEDNYKKCYTRKSQY